MEHTGLLFLFTCQPTKSSNFSRSGVNVRAHLLRKSYSKNFSSIGSTPLLYSWFYITNYTNVSLECKRLFLNGPPVGEMIFLLKYDKNAAFIF